MRYFLVGFSVQSNKGRFGLFNAPVSFYDMPTQKDLKDTLLKAYNAQRADKHKHSNITIISLSELTYDDYVHQKYLKNDRNYS
jgi:hypothetical protein